MQKMIGGYIDKKNRKNMICDRASTIKAIEEFDNAKA